MPRVPRITHPGLVYHLLNRRIIRLPLLEKDADYAAFLGILPGSLLRPDAPGLLAYCLMPAHWPAPRPRRWLAYVNRPIAEARRAQVRVSLARGRPLGDDGWTARTVMTLDLETTLRPRGRPRKKPRGKSS